VTEYKYTEDDVVLLAAMRQNDRAAYNILFKKYYPTLCAYCYRFVRVEEIEDIVQEVMMWLWENRHTEIIKTALKPYLYRMVYNRALNHIHQNEIKFRVEQFFQERIEDEFRRLDPVNLEEMTRRTNEAINRLPENYREVFVMHRLKDMSYKSIAEQLQISPKTVDYRIQQALKLLRIWLKDYLSFLMPLLG
jgi:RNA polymerase sigma-70 factor